MTKRHPWNDGVFLLVIFFDGLGSIFNRERRRRGPASWDPAVDPRRKERCRSVDPRRCSAERDPSGDVTSGRRTFCLTDAVLFFGSHRDGLLEPTTTVAASRSTMPRVTKRRISARRISGLLPYLCFDVPILLLVLRDVVKAPPRGSPPSLP